MAYISNNSFIDGITHRQMRKTLLQSFDKIYILDLHGSAKKNETAPDGSADQNVFDIMQGVSINIFVKTGNKKANQLGKVFHQEIFGKREIKYDLLWENTLKTFKWKELNLSKPNFFFVPKDFSQEGNYSKGFKLDELFSQFVSGFQTKRDKITIKMTKNELQNVKQIFSDLKIDEIRRTLELPEDGRDWTVEWAKNDLSNNNPQTIKIMYRPFDDRFTFYTGKSKGFVAYPRAELFSHLNRNENVSLITCRQLSTFDFQHLFASRLVSDMCNISSQTKETGYIFPLFNFSKNFDKEERTPNLNEKIVAEIGKSLGLKFVAEKEQNEKTFSPIDILDYIYAVLHSPAYRKKYKEFLKIDFPRVPFPKDKNTFWKLVALGKQIREIHLLESPTVEKYITQYPESGDNVVKKIKFVPDHKPQKQEKQPSFSTSDDSGSHDGSDDTSFPQPQLRSNEDMQLHESEEIYHITPKLSSGKVYINETQYFANVPERAWNFYIGGYQPAQKWLKDRKDRTLEFDDILHYQKIIVALSETDKLMKEIDKLEIE